MRNFSYTTKIIKRDFEVVPALEKLVSGLTSDYPEYPFVYLVEQTADNGSGKILEIILQKDETRDLSVFNRPGYFLSAVLSLTALFEMDKNFILLI